MELTQDLTVLQSAILLAEKNCDGLVKHPKGGNSKVRLILTDAISEITQGLRRNLDAATQDGLRFKIAGVLVALSLRREGGDGTAWEKEEFWFSVLHGLPALSKGLFYDLVKTCGLQRQFFIILSHVDQSLGLRLLSDLVSYLDLDPDDLDIALLVDLLEYLFLVDNPYIHELNKDQSERMRKTLTPSELDICTNLSKLAKTLSGSGSRPTFTLVKDGVVEHASIAKLVNMVPDTLKTCSADHRNMTVLMCVANALSDLAAGSGLLVVQPNYLSQPLANFLKEKALKNTFTTSEAQKLFLATQDERITKDLVHSVKSQVKPVSEVIDLLADILLKMTHQKGKAINLNDLISETNEKNLTTPEPQKSTSRSNPKSVSGHVKRVISSHHCRMILSHLAKSLRLAESSDTDLCSLVNTAPAREVLARCNELLAGQTVQLSDLLGDKLWDWCRVAVTARIDGHKEIFEQCLEEDIPKKAVTKWLELLEVNLPLLGSAAIVNKWLRFAVRLVQREKKSMTTTTVRMLTLAAYKKLPLSDQAAVIVFAHREGFVSALWEGGAQLTMKMTTAFNRLVKNTGNVKTSLGAVSELLLQAPRETLKKMVHQAVYNNGLAKLMAEILQSLPGVGQLSGKDGTSLLVTLIGQAAGWDLSRSEEQNLLSFVRHLFQMSTPDCTLLDPHQLVSSVILPNLVHQSEATKQTQATPPEQQTPPPQTQAPPPTRSLSLLRISLETRADDVTWLVTPPVQPAPLMFCLCGMVDACCPMYAETGQGEEVEEESKYSLKEQLVVVISMVIECLLKRKDALTGKDLTWLYNSMLRLHWTTLLYLAPLFTAMNPDKDPVATPQPPKEAPVNLDMSATQPQSVIDNLKKCKNFLSNLINLCSSKPAYTVENVKNLIQDLIDGKIQPEDFTEKLQVELKSASQPHLVPFFKENLPLLRQSMSQNKMQIEGIRPPPPEVVQAGASATAPQPRKTLHTAQIRVPEVVRDLVCLPPGWATFSYSGPGDPVYLTLEAVRVCGKDTFSQQKDKPLPEDFYIRAVAALAMLLPDSLPSEAESMVSWLLSAGVADRLQPHQLISYAYVPEDLYGGVTGELGACHLLSKVLCVVSAAGLSHQSHHANLHIANTHVGLMKTFCLSAVSPDRGALCVLLAECFARLCHQRALFPAGCGEPLYVLVLSVLQTYGVNRQEVLKQAETSEGLRDVLSSQTKAMCRAAEVCPPEERSMLVKTMAQQEEVET